MSKAAALLFLTVFAILAVKPESAKFRPDLLLPPVFSLDEQTLVDCSHSRLLVGLRNSRTLNLNSCLTRLLARKVANGRVESSHLRSHFIHILIRKVAVLRGDCRRISNGALCVVVCLLLNFGERQRSHLGRLDSGRVKLAALDVCLWLYETHGLLLLEILLRRCRWSCAMEIHLKLGHVCHLRLLELLRTYTSHDITTDGVVWIVALLHKVSWPRCIACDRSGRLIDLM